MFDSYNISTPYFTIELEGYGLSRWQLLGIAAVMFAVSLVLTVGLLWLYAVYFASLVGFETAVLVGIGLLVIVGGTD